MFNERPGQYPARGKSRKGTFFTVTFPTMPTLERKPVQVELVQKQNHHDILTLTFKKTSEYWFTEIPTGLPVQFEWTQLGVTSTWVGYVSYVSKVVTALGDKTMEVVCIGSSFPLKERDTRVFSESTIPDAVARIATDFGLEFVGDPHPRKFAQLIMAGHSYWEWIQLQAQKIGYAAYMDGVTLYFRKVDKVISQNEMSIPVLSIEDKTTFAGQLFYDRTLEYFKVLKGDYVESEPELRTVKHTGGVDPITGKAHFSSASPDKVGQNIRENSNAVLFKEYQTDRVASTEQTGLISAEDAAQLSRFTLPAKAKGLGDYRMKPFATVEVAGTGDSTDGFWIIKEVTHTFGKFGIYEVDLVLLTDGTGQSIYRSTQSARAARKDIVNISEKLTSKNVLRTANYDGQIALKSPTLPVVSSQQNFQQSLSRWIAR